MHLDFHRVAAGRADHVRMNGVVKHVEAQPKLTLELMDGVGGVSIRHGITAGWSSIGRLLDPLLRLLHVRLRRRSRNCATTFIPRRRTGPILGGPPLTGILATRDFGP